MGMTICFGPANNDRASWGVFIPIGMEHHIKYNVKRIWDRDRNNTLKKCNVAFSKQKFLQSNAQANSATGPGDIHYQFLKRLPDVSTKLLLLLLNNMW